MSDERRIEYIAVSELMTRLHPQNPKEHDLGALIESFKVHGYVASGVIDDRTGLFLAGHGRVQALNMMQKQGMNAPQGIRNGGGDWLAPVQVGYSSKNDVQAKAYIVADNRLTTLGGWNEVALAELLQELENSDEIDIGTSGYDADDLDELLRDLGMQEEPPDDPGAQVDRAAELNKKWQVKRGDVWQIGAHRIMCGDSTSAEDVALLMGGVKPSMIFADPMYNAKPTIIDETMNLMEGSCHVFVMGSDSLIADIVARHREHFRRFFVCYTPGGCPAISVYMPIVYADIMAEFLIGKTSFVNLHDAFGTVVKTSKHLEHLDIKAKSKRPDFIGQFIAHYTATGGAVLDPFLGSGTTVIAAEQLGRVCFGMEIVPELVAVCLERGKGAGLTPQLLGV